MRKSMFFVAAMLIASSAYASDNSRNLSSKQLRAAISGKTIYLQTPIGAEVPVRYRSNGTMTGKSSIQLAALAGEAVSRDRGRWWVQKSQLCQKWNNWSDGRAYCYRLKIKGSSVRWIRNDGKSGTARLSK